MPNTTANYDAGSPVYLRIGDWHESGRSRNYSTGETEAGVSVYDLAPDGSIVVPWGEWSQKDLFQRMSSGQPRYLVQGEWVGSGGEDEPVLRNIVKIGLWPQDLPSGFRSSLADVKGEVLMTAGDDAAFRCEQDTPSTFRR